MGKKRHKPASLRVAGRRWALISYLWVSRLNFHWCCIAIAFFWSLLSGRRHLEDFLISQPLHIKPTSAPRLPVLTGAVPGAHPYRHSPRPVGATHHIPQNIHQYHPCCNATLPPPHLLPTTHGTPHPVASPGSPVLTRTAPCSAPWPSHLSRTSQPKSPVHTEIPCAHHPQPKKWPHSADLIRVCRSRVSYIWRPQVPIHIVLLLYMLSRMNSRVAPDPQFFTSIQKS